MGKKSGEIKHDAYALKNRVWFLLNIVCTCVYLIWRLFFTVPFEYGVVSVVAGLSLFLVEFLGMLEALIHYFNMYEVEVNPIPDIPIDKYPEVDVFIATYNEPCELLYKTVNGCKFMQYPDKNKVHIFLCDDGRRAEVRELAARMGVGYLDREDNQHAKAGNLNHALSVTNAPYVVTFDADMIPKRDFLMHTIPYFIDMEMKNEEKKEGEQMHMGFVQTPQSFYNPDLFQYFLYSELRIPNEQDYFYRDIQVSRNKSNSVIYGGSNTVLSRRALDDIGGFYTGTITEDYATGILIQKKGYICYATDDVLASGISPTDLKSLIDQRIRWARGVITSNRKMHVFRSKDLRFTQKMNYWASEWYWYAPLKRLIYFMSPILYATFGYMVLKCTLWQVLLFWLPMYITSNVSLRMLSRNIRTTKWTSVYETVLFPFLLIPVILETFGVTMKKFKVTNKDRNKADYGKNPLYLIPFILLIVLSVVGIFNCLRMIFESNDMGPVVVLFWLIVNLFTLVMAMFFVLGRKFMRKSERAQVNVECELKTSGGVYNCMTRDISEEGVALILEKPINVHEAEEAELRISDGPYTAQLKIKTAHVDDQKESWKYAFKITDYCGTYDQYLQIIYDRIPTLPQKLDITSGGYDDLRINITRRAAKPFYENRRLPRVSLCVQLPDEEGKLYHLVDFNYQYCTVKSDVDSLDEMKLTINKEIGLSLLCRKVNSRLQGRVLYKIVNYEEIYRDKVKNSYLEAWLKEQWQKGKKDKNQTLEMQKVGHVDDFDEMKHL